MLIIDKNIIDLFAVAENYTAPNNQVVNSQASIMEIPFTIEEMENLVLKLTNHLKIVSRGYHNEFTKSSLNGEYITEQGKEIEILKRSIKILKDVLEYGEL